MTPREVIVDQQAFTLGRLIGKGGEGVVHALGVDEKFVIKLYNTTGGASKEAKIAAMISATLASNAPLVAFPLSIARSRSGAFLGFVMRRISDHKPLHDLYSPGSRKQQFPQADYRFLVRAAANLARAVASVHQSNCVIGDINHSGILVSPKATTALIDADSFQFCASGRQHLCVVGVPEYTPPELQGKSLAGEVRNPNHDAFGLAVVVFQLLLMGRHPFVGTVRKGEIPPLQDNIKNYRYVYAEHRDVGMDQPPGTPALSDFAPAIASLFELAFARETMSQRPTAAQWAKRLDELERSLAQCQENSLHYAPKDASECAWCEMEHQTGAVLFLPNLPRTDFNDGHFDPGANGFQIDQIWAAIMAIALPTREQLKPPQIVVNTMNPGTAAKQAKEANSKRSPVGFVMCAIAIAAAFAAPTAIVLWVGLFVWGAVLAQKKASIDRVGFQRVFIQAEQVWGQEIASWHQRIGINNLQTARDNLAALKDSYKQLGAEERSLLATYQTERKEKQLYAYLDTFDIQHATFKGIGPAKRALLASYGIDTAADVSKTRLMALPGFGEATSNGLIEWRTKLTRGFVYRTEQNEADHREHLRIRSAIDLKAAPMRQKLHAGPQNLPDAIRQVMVKAKTADPILTRAFQEREQARFDLLFLDIPVPSVVLSPASVQPSPRARAVSPQPRATTALKSQQCPRCSSPMVRRTAHRGRNAGGQFWGCSRYPGCKGTRNI